MHSIPSDRCTIFVSTINNLLRPRIGWWKAMAFSHCNLRYLPIVLTWMLQGDNFSCISGCKLVPEVQVCSMLIESLMDLRLHKKIFTASNTTQFVTRYWRALQTTMKWDTPPLRSLATTDYKTSFVLRNHLTGFNNYLTDLIGTKDAYDFHHQRHILGISRLHPRLAHWRKVEKVINSKCCFL